MAQPAVQKAAAHEKEAKKEGGGDAVVRAKDEEIETLQVQGLLEIKNTHRPWGGPMLLGTGLP